MAMALNADGVMATDGGTGRGDGRAGRRGWGLGLSEGGVMAARRMSIGRGSGGQGDAGVAGQRVGWGLVGVLWWHGHRVGRDVSPNDVLPLHASDRSPHHREPFTHRALVPTPPFPSCLQAATTAACGGGTGGLGTASSRTTRWCSRAAWRARPPSSRRPSTSRAAGGGLVGAGVRHGVGGGGWRHGRVRVGQPSLRRRSTGRAAGGARGVGSTVKREVCQRG